MNCHNSRYKEATDNVCWLTAKHGSKSICYNHEFLQLSKLSEVCPVHGAGIMAHLGTMKQPSTGSHKKIVILSVGSLQITHCSHEFPQLCRKEASEIVN